MSEVERGEVTRRTTLLEGGEGKPENPQYARFHATADGTLHVVYAATVWDGDGSSRVENRLIRVSPGQEGHRPIRLVLDEPLTTFFTATERGQPRLGCPGPLRHRPGPRHPPLCPHPPAVRLVALRVSPQPESLPHDHRPDRSITRSVTTPS